MVSAVNLLLLREQPLGAVGALVVLALVFITIFAVQLASVVVVINLLTDLTYALLDPRVRYE